MTKAAPGRSYLAIPGPSVAPDAVLGAMHRTPPNIYGGEIVEITKSLVPDLKRVARTAGQVAMYIGNGHAAWEAALANTIAPGDKILVLATGRFAFGWCEMAQALGAETQVIDFGKQAPVDPDRLREALLADGSHQIKAVMAVHVDTSTSLRSDIASLRAVLDDLGHPALLMVDCIASLGCDVFEMDDWGVDLMVTGCQKGLMVPPGLAFVFYNARAEAARAALPRISRYWDWAPRSAPDEFYQYWCGTAPTQHIFGLRKALDLLHDEGLDAVWQRHATLARAIWAACETWGSGGPMRLNLADPNIRSNAVTALSIAPDGGYRLRNWTQTRLNLTLGIGLGMGGAADPEARAYFRIGHMGHLSGQMVMGLLGGIEAGLTALQIPKGSGALEAAAREIAAGETAPG